MLLQLCFSEGVEQCVPWAENTTQQIDLAFNIFFMVYFFIRVRSLIEETVLSKIEIFILVHRRLRQVLVHAGVVFLR